MFELDPSGLLPYQPRAGEQILRSIQKYNSAVDGSDMGVGKTFTAGAVIRALNKPTLVICPAVAMTSWRRMGQALGIEFDVLNYEMLRTGKTSFGTWENPRKDLFSYLKCSICQRFIEVDRLTPCPYHYAGIHCVETKKLPHKYGKFNWYDGIGFLVFDEVHRCSALKSMQADMLIAGRRQNITTLGLSATLADSPLNLRALGYAIGLHSLVKRNDGSPGFYEWAMSLGCRKLPVGGWHFAVGETKRHEIMTRIHSQIFPEHGTRIRILALGDAFPECQITAELYDIEKSGRINVLYEDMDDAIQEFHKSVLDRVSEAHPLTRILRARQEVELLKVPIFQELTEDALSQGNHVAIFVNFRQTLDELAKRLKTNCRVDGSQIGEEGKRIRQKNVDNFQADKEPVILCSADAGGIGIDLHDIHGKFPRLGLGSPAYSSRVMRQEFGRIRRAGGKSKSLFRVLFIAGTVEEKIHRAVSRKLDCLDLLNDGDLLAGNLPLTQMYSDAILEYEND